MGFLQGFDKYFRRFRSVQIRSIRPFPGYLPAMQNDIFDNEKHIQRPYRNLLIPASYCAPPHNDRVRVGEVFGDYAMQDNPASIEPTFPVYQGCHITPLCSALTNVRQ